MFGQISGCRLFVFVFPVVCFVSVDKASIIHRLLFGNTTMVHGDLAGVSPTYDFSKKLSKWVKFMQIRCDVVGCKSKLSGDTVM